MKVYIFGAGASRAAQGVNWQGLKAPLVNDLFNPEYEDFAKEMGISSIELNEFKKSFENTENRSLEEWLTMRWDGMKNLQSTQTIRAEEKLFGRLTFYIWWLMVNISNSSAGENLYNDFMRKLVLMDEHFGLINFNYDVLLDKAYQKVGDTFANPNHSLNIYLEQNYIKPHGSINWLLQRRPGEQLPNDLISANYKIRYEHAAGQMFKNRAKISMNNIKIIDPLNQDLNRLRIIASSEFNGQFFYPLILLPLSTKLFEQIEDFKIKIIDSAKNMISRASEIYFIGYRAQDEVIKEILSPTKRGTKLYIIGKGNTNDIARRILKIQPNFILEKTSPFGFEFFINNEM